jgi:hypothetical protein
MVSLKVMHARIIGGGEIVKPSAMAYLKKAGTSKKLYETG